MTPPTDQRCGVRLTKTEYDTLKSLIKKAQRQAENQVTHHQTIVTGAWFLGFNVENEKLVVVYFTQDFEDSCNHHSEELSFSRKEEKGNG